MTISVMITTRNRSAELRRTCRVLRDLNPAPLEILITADGCTDNAVEVVKSELPNAKLIVNETGRGSVVSRNQMMREARGDLVLALDEYPETLTQPNFGPEHLTRSFANSGAVLRRATYRQLPGFESLFFSHV